jgi:hypothetical protein
MTRTILIASLVLALAPRVRADDKPFTPTAVFDGCDGSKTKLATCHLYAGKKPDGYTPMQDGCMGRGSRATQTCPAEKLLGVCETRGGGAVVTYRYYYESPLNANIALMCAGPGLTWHKA